MNLRLRARLLCGALSLAGGIFAGQTKTWQQTDFADFDKGSPKGVSLRSDGRLSLAPRFVERLDSSSAYLWALVGDSKGNLYAGGGPQAKLYRIPATGQAKTIAEFESALEIHALAVDREDRVYAATSPDSKIYRIAGSAKPELFYDPKVKYVWAMAFSPAGDLYLATGDQGEIHRVTPDGKGSVFFRTEEAHARSLAIDAKGNLIVGTEPGGLVLRISAPGQGFVLHQMSKREVTAVTVAADGSIYAAAVGGKPGAVQPPAAPPPAAPASPPPAISPAAARPASAPPSLAPPPAISGGSEIVRIYPDGYPRRVWSHAQDLVYTLLAGKDGMVLAGTGNKGQIYRIESDLLYSALINATPTQVTGLCGGPGGEAYAATGNPGKVYQIGPDLEKEGTLESEVFDAGLFSTWGRLDFTAEDNGGKISITTRSGNLDRPQKNWSEWSPPITAPAGARITSPPARFLQYKVRLEASSAGHSPWLHQVEAAYLGKNVPPQVEQIEITPANYRFPAVTLSIPSSRTLNLPPIGKSGRTAAPSADAASAPAMVYAKGFLGARWAASDDNADTLSFSVYLKGVKESAWKPLKENFRERYLSWDTTAFADGEYRIRVAASDAPSNPREEALTEMLDSYTFLIDNTPPRIHDLHASRSGGRLVVTWSATDLLNVITRAEYSIDGAEWLIAAPKGKISDSLSLDYVLSLDAPAGEHTIAVRVQDEFDNVATEKVVVRP